jgi:hypothetical protein
VIRVSELRSWKKNGLPANPRTQATSPIHSYGEVEMTYYAIGTDPEEAEGGVPRSAQPSVFPLLRSLDLVEWRAAGHAMVMVDQAPFQPDHRVRCRKQIASKHEAITR